MRHPFFVSGRPLVFAHRGGSALAPENTIAAFDAGLACGADGLEFDVRLSRDGIVVVHHDRVLGRTVNLTGAVADRTADELARADAGHFFRRGDTHPFRGVDLGVPRLSEVLARYRDVPIVIELKVNSPDLARAVVSTVRAAGSVDRVCVGSFGLRALSEVRRLDARLATSAAREEVRLALYRSWCRWPRMRAPYAGYQVPEWSGRTRVVSPRFIDAAHRAGFGLHVWTVDIESDARRFLDWGADGLITDRPDVVVPVVRRHDDQRGAR